MTLRRVHVVGCHRSGTTLMMELLWYAYPFSGRSTHESSVFAPVPPGETLYLTKKPPDTTRLRRIFLADDALHVIAMQRDPRAVITSRHPDFPDVYFSSYRRFREYDSAITALAHHPRFLVVRFEDLVRDPDAVQAAVEARFPFLTRRRAFADFPEGAAVPDSASISLSGTRPFDATRIDGWRDHLPRVKGQLERHPDLADAVVRLGYESDSGWLEALETVDAYRQTYKEDEARPWRRAETALRYWWKTRRYLARLPR